jgi:hypothetical protein
MSPASEATELATITNPKLPKPTTWMISGKRRICITALDTCIKPRLKKLERNGILDLIRCILFLNPKNDISVRV